MPVEELRARGLLLRSFHDDQVEPRMFSVRRASVATCGVQLFRAEVLEKELPVRSSATVVLAHLLGPLFTRWVGWLQVRGAEVGEHLGDDVYTLRLDGDPEMVADLPFVGRVRPYEVSDRIRVVTAPEALREVDPAVTVDVTLHSFGDEGLADWIEDNGGQVIEAGSRRVRYIARRDGMVTWQLSSDPAVALIDEAPRTEPANDHARALVGIATVGSHRGAGQVVAVADTGIDSQHPDLAGKLKSVVDLAGRGATSDTDGHGTHVAASIAGAPSPPGQYGGMASDAQLHFQAISDASGQLIGARIVSTILRDAEQNGASIVNFSWVEQGGAGRYSASADALDEFVWDSPELLVVVAAGNQGTEATAVSGQVGALRRRTVAPPGTAKNCLCVGASRSDRIGVQAPQPQDWKTWFPPNRFLNDPIATEALSGDDQALDARSGRGPCAENYRIKPDVVAPATFICSARANVGAAGSFWALHAQPDYAYNGGSSMATAIVSGCAAIARDWLVNACNHTPSAALLRALLVNGTTWLTAWDAVQDGNECPNYHQGFGRIDMARTLPDPSRPDLTVEVLDADVGNGLALDDPDQPVWLTFEVTRSAHPLRLCLAWTDPPGVGVQHPLELVLTLDSPTDPDQPLDIRRGNERSPGRLAGSDEADRWNNVHVIRFNAPDPGTYTVSVSPNVATFRHGPQPFALVISGCLTVQIPAHK
ncbi:MAG: S8 family serine peptidase [Acidimicrobiales bacterium]